MATGTAAAADPSLDPEELAKFAALGRSWWDPLGPMAPLHKLNPVRVGYVRDRACERFGRDPHQGAPLRSRGSRRHHVRAPSKSDGCRQ